MGCTACTELQCLYKGALYLFYIRVLYMPWKCLPLLTFILTYSKALLWMGANCLLQALVSLHPVQICPLIHWTRGWVGSRTSPVALEKRKEKSVPPPPPPEMEWFLCCMASRLDDILITGSQLSMIRSCSCYNSLMQWWYSWSWCCRRSILRCKCIYREVSLWCLSVPGKITEFCLKLQHGCFCSCIANMVFTLLEDDSNLRRPLKNKHLLRENILLLISYT